MFFKYRGINTVHRAGYSVCCSRLLVATGSVAIKEGFLFLLTHLPGLAVQIHLQVARKSELQAQRWFQPVRDATRCRLK